MMWRRCSLLVEAPKKISNEVPTQAPANIPIVAPTKTPTRTPTSAPTNTHTCFQTKIELKEAILKYRVGSETENSEVKGKYGSVMGNWCVGQVTNFSYLFSTLQGSILGFNEDISRWNTSSVTNMRNMFAYQYDFNQDLSRWDGSQVTVLTSMFFISRAFNQDISSWDVSKVTDMSEMFKSASYFNIYLGMYAHRYTYIQNVRSDKLFRSIVSYCV
jgi:surface protein